MRTRPVTRLTSVPAVHTTPNHLQALSVSGDLINNLLTPGVPASVTFGLLAIEPVGGACNPATPSAQVLEPGLRGWATTTHVLPTAGYGVTEVKLSIASLSGSELAKLTSTCGFIQADGSGHGICNSCRAGALGASANHQ